MRAVLLLLSRILQKPFLPVLTARQTAQMVENLSDCPQKEVTKKSRQTRPWCNQQPSQTIRFVCLMDDQALFAASNACFIFIIHKSKSLGKFKCICKVVKTEENYFLHLFVLNHTIIRHCMHPIKNVLLLLHDCIFISLQFFSAPVAHFYNKPKAMHESKEPEFY